MLQLHRTDPAFRQSTADALGLEVLLGLLMAQSRSYFYSLRVGPNLFTLDPKVGIIFVYACVSIHICIHICMLFQFMYVYRYVYICI